MRDGLIAAMTVAENYILDTYHREPYSTRGRLDRQGDRDAARRRASRTSTSGRRRSRRWPARCRAATSRRSSSRASSRGPLKLVVASQPTRGLDVGSIEYIHRRIVEQRTPGAAVLIVSTELDEVLAVGDRIAVMFGRPDRRRSWRAPEATYEKRRHADGRRRVKRVGAIIRPGRRPDPRHRHRVHRRLDLHPHHRLREPLEARHGPGRRDQRRPRHHRRRVLRDDHRRLRRPGQDRRRARRSNDPKAIAAAIRPITETLVAATPLIFTGLAVAISFRSGVFNIGVEGQFVLGAFGRDGRGDRPERPAAAGLILLVRSPPASLTGAAWGFIPGFLKARTGAHEVITTIMLNYVAAQIVLFGLRSDFLRQAGQRRSRSPRSCRTSSASR